MLIANGKHHNETDSKKRKHDQVEDTQVADKQRSNELLDSKKLRLGPIEDDEKPSEPSPAARNEAFRNYEDAANKRHATVSKFYHEHHTKQTFDFVLECERKYNKLEKKQMSMWDATQLLNEIVDDSDPDTEFSQIIHLVQTGESLRKLFPGEEYDWLHLTGFIHDLGKLLAHPKMHGLEQFCVVGDTFPVGCAHDPAIVYHDSLKENPDFHNPKYNTKLGIYREGCGLDNVHMTYGHDEYMYQVCVQNGCTLPPQALAIIRYHSFYPWHNKGAYDHLCNDTDRKMLEWVKKFQLHDLYSKLPETPDLNKTLPYYKKLMEKYFPPVLRW
jgi:inositol oxygenase